MPGQAYENGLGFIQNYFGMPLALILVAAVFVPMYKHFNVFTAYEYLGKRFDTKTRLLGAALFLTQRGLAAGITLYAPAIILSSMLGWRQDVTIILSGILTIAYTMSGGSAAVSLTHKYQMSLIGLGMLLAMILLVLKMPSHLSLTDTLTIAGGFHKMEAVDFSLDPNKRYTFWSGMLGGFFLSLSYFGTDQSQVQRYISGESEKNSKLGLLFNAVFKIPMQFLILMIGVLLFVFYQFERPPIVFNEVAWKDAARGVESKKFKKMELEFESLHFLKEQKIKEWMQAEKSGLESVAAPLKSQALALHEQSQTLRADAKTALQAAMPLNKSNDYDYIFITYVLHFLPHGLIGLLISAILAAALGSKASELNALSTTTTIDFLKPLFKHKLSDHQYMRASQGLTVFWGFVAIGFALFANMLTNMIEAANIIGSLFYGVTLALFLVAFFLKWVRGTALFYSAITAQVAVFLLYSNLSISYLWYNLIGCAICVVLSGIYQGILGKRS